MKSAKSKFKTPTTPSALSRKDYQGAYTGVDLGKVKVPIGKTFKKAPK